MTKKLIPLLVPLFIVILAAGLAAGALFRRFGEKEDYRIRTDTEPIYHHFPDLPRTEDMEWCSTSSGGIGLVTTRLYLYCWYDHDIREELLDLEPGQEIGQIERTEQTLDVFYFIPERLIEQPQVWSKLDHGDFAFQTGIKDGEKMNTVIYLSADGTVLYLEAVGD